MTSSDKARLAAGCICSSLSGVPFYWDVFHILLAALICCVVAATLAIAIAGRSRPRNWKRISIWFFSLSIIVPSVVFILLSQFREGL